MSYESLPNMELFLKEVTATPETTLISALLPTVSDAIDRYCQRTFVGASDTPAVAHTYELPASSVLCIHDYQLITSIVIDGTNTLTTSQYAAYPRVQNAYLDSISTAILRLTGASGVPQVWAMRGQFSTATIVANWGWAAVPSPVVQVCQIMTARLYKRQIVGYEDSMGMNAGGFQSIKTPPCSLDEDCKLMLKSFRRLERYPSLPAWREQ